MLVSASRRTDVSLHPLLEVRKVESELVVVVSTDKGLCGALNTNLLREVNQFDPAIAGFISAGRKAQQYLVRSKRRLVADFPVKAAPTFMDTKVISKYCMEQFLAGAVDKVSVLFTHFLNTLVQRPVVRTLLPISPFDLPSGTTYPENAEEETEYLYEPTPTEVLSGILPHYIHSRFTRWCWTPAPRSTAPGWLR